MNKDDYTRDLDSEPSPASLGLTDVYFVLFRRKWLVLSGVVLGVLAAAALWKLRPPLYQSQAKLLVRYVLEPRSPALGADPQMRTPDGGSVIGTEAEILSSLDIAQEVAGVVGPDKILGKAENSNDLSSAGNVILKNLRVEPSPHSSI